MTFQPIPHKKESKKGVIYNMKPILKSLLLTPIVMSLISLILFIVVKGIPIILQFLGEYTIFIFPGIILVILALMVFSILYNYFKEKEDNK